MPFPSPQDEEDDPKTPLEYQLYGNPANPFNQLSSSHAMALSKRRPVKMQFGGASDPSDPEFGPDEGADTPGAWANVPGVEPEDQPLLPGTERYQQIAANPKLTENVQPSGWRTALGLAAQWMTRRHPQLGQAVSSAITSTDPRVKAHQQLLNEYAIAQQQAQAERQNMQTAGNLALRNTLAGMRADTAAGNQRNQQRERGWRASPSSVSVPTAAGMALPTVTSPGVPELPQLSQVTSPSMTVPRPAGALPPDAPQGSTAEKLGGTSTEGYIPPPAALEEEKKAAALKAAQTEEATDEMIEGGLAKKGEMLSPYQFQAKQSTLEKRQQNEDKKHRLEDTVEGREKLADKYGLQGDSRQAFVLTGKLPTETGNEYRDFRAGYLQKHPNATGDEIATAYSKMRPKDFGVTFIGPEGTIERKQPGEKITPGSVTPADYSKFWTPGGATKSRADQARTILEASDTLTKSIDAHRAVLGNLESYWKSFVNQSPIANPEASLLMSELASFAALQPALHGFRSHDALREFANIIGGIPKNAESLKASIQGIQETARAVAHSAEPRTPGGGGGGGGGGNMPTVKTQAEYDALPTGTVYLEDGKKFKKP